MACLDLGDVVVGWPKTEDDPAVVNWDFGAVEQHGPNVTNLRQVGQMKEPDAPILAALGRLLGNHREGSTRFDEYLRRLDRIAQFGHPGRSSDRLFQPDCVCQTPNATILCSCDPTKLVKRKWRPERGMSFLFHQGTILSGNSFMMNAAVCDELRARYPNALCLEMEAAGALPQSRALVVRGICDYADSHVNRKWQNYAAGTAAAFVRELLFTKAPQALHDRPNAPQMSSTAQEMVRCFAFNRISLNRGNKYLNYRRDVWEQMTVGGLSIYERIYVECADTGGRVRSKNTLPLIISLTD